MLCCFAEIGIFVAGIICLVRGKFNLTGSRVVEGASARVIGVLLLFPLILGQGGEATYGFVWGARQAARGRPVDIATAQRELLTIALVINAIGTGVPLLIALAIALTSAKPVGRKRDLYREEDEDDYGDRRGGRDDEDEDRPRRRRRDDDYPD